MKRNGMIVAVNGRNVRSGDPEDIIYSSEDPSPKQFAKVPGEIVTDGSGNAIANIIHKLPYSPVYLIYLNPTISNVNDNYPMPKSYGLITNNSSVATSAPNTIRIDIQNGKPNFKYKFMCFIFAEPAKNE